MGDLSELTEKEREALLLVANNLSSKEIARHLDISPSAVDQRIDNARRKLGGIRRAEAARRVQKACEDLPWDAIPVVEASTMGPSPLAPEGIDEAPAASGAAPLPQAGGYGFAIFDPAPGREPDELDTVARLKIIFNLALKIAVLIVVMLGVVAGLEGTFER